MLDYNEKNPQEDNNHSLFFNIKSLLLFIINIKLNVKDKVTKSMSKHRVFRAKIILLDYIINVKITFFF